MANEIKASEQYALSTDINVITAEINAYQRVAGEAIFEIGRRLKHVKENDLAHGEWSKWCESELGFDRQYANKFIRVYEEIGDGSTYTRLGLNSLYLIATLPPEHREAEHELPSGKTKKPEDMTVRELRELKKALKEREQELERTSKQADTERQIRERLEEQVDELSAREQQAEQEVETLRAELERAKEANPFAETPYGVKLGLAMYDAFEELSKWQKEYSWVITDKTEFRKMVEGDPNFAREFNRLDKFWRQMSEVFHGTSSKGVYRDDDEVVTEVIDVDFTEVI